MDRFSYLLRKKSKALKVFQEAQSQLSNVIAALQYEITGSEKMIKEKEASIEKEKEAILFAQKEIQAAEQTRMKIEEILK